MRINVELFSVVRRNHLLRATLGSRLRWERLFVTHWCFFFLGVSLDEHVLGAVSDAEPLLEILVLFFFAPERNGVLV